MLARTLMVTFAILLSACAIRVGPPNVTRMPVAKGASVFDEITGSYCFCSNPKNQKPHVNGIEKIGYIKLNQLGIGSVLSVKPFGSPASGLEFSVHSNNKLIREEVLDRSTGGCFIGRRTIRCNQYWSLGAVFGPGIFQETIEFSNDKSGALRIKNSSGVCGLALFIIPFCEAYNRQFVLPASISDHPCQCPSETE